MSLLQKCTNCWEEKVLTEYYPKRRGWNEIRTECIECMKAKSNARYHFNKIRLEAEEESRKYRRNLLKWLIKVLIWLLIVGWIVAVTAKC